MNIGKKIIQLLEKYDIPYMEKERTIQTVCPSCNRSDKFSILKANGHSICYHGSCDYGKAFFEKFLMINNRVSYNEAHEILHGQDRLEEGDLKIDWFDEREKVVDKPADILLVETEWPPTDCVNILSYDAKDGAEYLQKRGITPQLAAYYKISYNTKSRRIVFPVIINGIVYGWQARAIDKDNPYKMLNNTGFRREHLVMFADLLIGKDYAILCEGPVDAIKFSLIGGSVCTMGKAITKHQIRLIESYGIKKWYLALDEDAAEEINALSTKLNGDVFIVTVPDSCKQRCKDLNKKADFGECTFLECKQAFELANKLDGSYIVSYLKY